MNEFDTAAGQDGKPGIFAGEISILQVNVGLRCNLSCTHCHLESGPGRHESMSRETMERVLQIASSIEGVLVDITGGSPELNVNLEWFIAALSERKIRAQLRTNLSALLGRERLTKLLAENEVSIVASLPCYLRENVDAQRGGGTYEASISALLALNALGYGRNIPLVLVYNPSGPFLPGPQAVLEEAYRQKLRENWGVEFTKLITITNMPLGRFQRVLEESGQSEAYLEKLKNSFNPKTLGGLMCRSQISIGWDGRVYDCDFNNALGLASEGFDSVLAEDFSAESMAGRKIVTGPHCFGCTAGQGSSCGGALD